jgi:cell wall assembly regulator SMI1
MEWAEGHTQDELDRAQELFGVTFPPDLVAFYLEKRPAETYDWTKDHDSIWRMLAWPYEGLWFDVVHNGLWWDSWGSKPERRSDQQDVLRAVLAAAPRLIPLFGHRFIPQSPCEAGNPVFSVYQSDLIVYGANLAHYFEREFASSSDEGEPWPEVKRIPFWSQIAEHRGTHPPPVDLSPEARARLQQTLDALRDGTAQFGPEITRLP